MIILREYEEHRMNVIEYTKDGETVSHVVKTPIAQESEPEELQPTIEEEILFETKYQTMILEMGGM